MTHRSLMCGEVRKTCVLGAGARRQEVRSKEGACSSGRRGKDSRTSGERAEVTQAEAVMWRSRSRFVPQLAL